VSGVSGGSLATAHLTFRKGRPLETVPFLRNSIQSELIMRFGTEYEDVRPSYKLEKANKLQATFAELYEADPRDSDLQWILGSGSADAMCTDFMAPLLRGVMTFGLERGESVSQFWQQRLAWINPDDKRPYHNLGHDPLRPLVVFNTTDARRGNRFLLGFPELPRRMFTLHLGRLPSARVTVQGTLTANDPLYPKYNMPVKVHLAGLREGQSYTFEMQRLDKSPRPEKGPDTRLDPSLLIEDPENQKILAEDDDSGGELNARIANFIAPKTGKYRVLASAFGPNRGAYELTVRQNPISSPIIPQSENGEFNPNTAYTQTLADFWPCYRLELTTAVRASANFPWGFQSCFLTRTYRNHDFRKEATRAALVRHGEELLHLLANEWNFMALDVDPNLDFEVDGTAAVDRKKMAAKWIESLNQTPLEKQLDTLHQIVRSLEQLSRDAHAPKDYRAQAKEILTELDETQKPAFSQDQIYMMDGGVNDNTGIATLVDVFQHLEAFAASGDPLVDAPNQTLAVKILQRMRQRGVIFLEIDSGAKPKSGVMHDLQTPLQTLENANFANAAADREVYLRQINKLLTPATHRKEGAGAAKGFKDMALKKVPEGGPGSKPSGPRDLPWVFHHLFMCNHSGDKDVMTAWALSPDDKARVMATFFCEFQKWKADQSEAVVAKWLNGREKELSPSKKDYRTPLTTFGSQLQANQRKRSEQQAEILSRQKMLK
jgi:hypothetical protein